MGRNEHFKDGSQQPDMFAEHFGEATSLSEPTMTADKQGRITYLGRDTSLGSGRMGYRAHGDYDPEPLHAGTASALYPVAGNLTTHEHDGSGLAPMGSHEISLVTVDPDRRRSGVATSMLQYSRQFGDIRHSMTRSSLGAKWSRSVGGPDVEGRDTRTYDYVQSHLIPQMIKRATKRDDQLTDAEYNAKQSVPHLLGIDRMY